MSGGREVIRQIALRFGLLGLAAGITGCTAPPPGAYVQGLETSQPVHQINVGRNSVGEACTLQKLGNGGANVFCGTWQQPSAHVLPDTAASGANVMDIATASAWRAGIDGRYACRAPTSTSILGGHPAALLQCVDRVGGWPHVAMVADLNDHVWFGDGVLPASNVMERAMGIEAGLLKPGEAPPGSEADALLAQRLAAQAFSSGDVGKFNELMAAGVRANLADEPAAAEAAFRAALAVQRKALGHDSPETALPLMSLALELSDEGRYKDAETLFAQAEKLAPQSADPTAVARLLQYRGLDLQNQHQDAKALTFLAAANNAYAEVLPADVLNARPEVELAAARGIAGQLPNSELFDPRVHTALVGLIEVRRNIAVMLQDDGKPREAATMLQSALDVARGNNVAVPGLTARLYRDSAITQASLGNNAQALTDLSQSTSAFSRFLPRSKPLAYTDLIHAAELVHAGREKDALPICENAVRSLADLKAGAAPALMASCLDAWAAAVHAEPAHAQKLLAEMFIASQLAQGSITSSQIAQATARLEANTRDPHVADAIRRRQDASGKLQALYNQRDSLMASLPPGAPPPPAMAALDKKIKAAQVNLAESDQALQAAAPNYGQLVQQVVPASAVLKALRPGEALADIVLGPTEGWTFLLRDGKIYLSKVPGGTPRMAKLVHQVRAGIELTTAGLPKFDVAGAQALYQATLAGAAPHLKGVSSLIVAPSGPLLSIPFEVLLTGKASPARLAEAPWLVRKFDITHVPSPGNFVDLRKVATGSRATQPWFGFGDFNPVTLAQARATFPGATCSDEAQLFAGLPRLPFAARELDAARAVFDASPKDELLGAQFTAKAVLAEPLKNFRILHFATHALLPSELRCESEPAIVTSAPAGATNASGALLTASEIAGMNLDANLVILSACNSGGGGGGATGGESLSGLARAFFFAGARSLLVSHWSVNDQVGAFIVADTLARMKADPALGVTGALRQTELSMLNEAGTKLPAEIAHPFFWAPFAAIGDGGRVAPMRTAMK